MNKDYKTIEDILIVLTNEIGYDNDNPKHVQAFRKAFKDLCKLVDEIDNAERL